MKNLTLEIAKTLIGKEIKTSYSGYKSQGFEDKFIIGSIVSQFELAENEDFSTIDSRFKTRAEYWESYMSIDQLFESKNKMYIITNDGRNTFIYCDNRIVGEKVFCCSDDDRYVSFEVIVSE